MMTVKYQLPRLTLIYVFAERNSAFFKNKSSINSVKPDRKQINLSDKCNVVPVLVHVLPRFRNVQQYRKSNILVYEQALEIHLIYGLFHFDGFV